MEKITVRKNCVLENTPQNVKAAIIGYYRCGIESNVISILVDMDEQEVELIISDYLVKIYKV